MCPCVSTSVSKTWSCVSHPNTTHRIPDIPAGRNGSTLAALSSQLLAHGGQMTDDDKLGRRNGTRALGVDPPDRTGKLA